MSAFEKGHKKVGGRQKGTSNRFNSNLQAICEDLGLNPFQALMEMAKDPTIETGHKLGALKELCEYLYPKRRRVEFDDTLHVSIVREVEALSKLPSDELARLAEEEIKKAKEDTDAEE